MISTSELDHINRARRKRGRASLTKAQAESAISKRSADDNSDINLFLIGVILAGGDTFYEHGISRSGGGDAQD